MIKNLEIILLLVPMWYLPIILFIPGFFDKFPYENKYVIKEWTGEVFLESNFKTSQKIEFIYHGEFYKAYLKLRLEALKVSLQYPQKEFGVSFKLGEKNVPIS